MTTISGSFTAVGSTALLKLGRYAEDVTYSISGTYNATVQVERSKSGGNDGPWEVVAGPFTTEDGTFTGLLYGEPKDVFRINVTAYTDGTVVTSHSDTDVIVREIKDLDGNVISTFRQSGVTFPGTFDDSDPVAAEITYAAGLATVATLGVAVKLVAVTAQKGDANGFTVGTDNTLTATFTNTKLCHIKGRFLVDNETADDALTLHVYVGGASAFETAAQTVTAATQKLYEIDVLLNVANGEAIEIYAENEDTTSNVDTIVAAERVDSTPAHGFLRVTGA